MKKIALLFNRNDNKIYFVALTISLLLSAWIFFRYPLVNPDGICYLLSAKMLATTHLKNIVHYCPQAQWPFYSSLIYGLSQLSHLSFFASAHFLNALFSLISVFSFILIVKEMGANKRILWLAAFVILFNHQFNVSRIEIIRDHGFWAFYLSSIFFMMKYFRKPNVNTALAWWLSIFVASLFRIEGFIFLFAMPFLSWLNFNVSLKQRVKSFFLFNVPLILMIVSLGVWQLYAGHTVEKLGRVNEIINQVHHGFTIIINQYYVSKAALINHLLTPDSIPDAGVLVILMWLSWYVYNVVLTLSFAYAALTLYAWKTKAAKIPFNASLVIYGYFILNLIITLAFLAERLFISKRYLVAFTLILMLWVPFALNDLLQNWKSWRHKIFLILMSILIFISGMSSVIHFGTSKVYIRTAGNWIATNVPENAKLYSNDIQLMYYSQHVNNQIFKLFPSYTSADTIAHQQWKNFDYLAIRVNHNNKDKTLTDVLQEIKNIKPIKIFNNNRGDSIAIYKFNYQTNFQSNFSKN